MLLSAGPKRVPICPRDGSDLVQASSGEELVCQQCGWTFPSLECDMDGIREPPAPADEGHLGVNLTSELRRLQRQPSGSFDPIGRGRALRRVDVRQPAIAALLEEFDRREQNRARYEVRRRVFLSTVQGYYREFNAKSKLVLEEMTRGHEFNDPPVKRRDRFDPRLDFDD
jgi:hypothetical protein